jgi:drug/metabolite transporter (DMT)-like permease
VTVVVAHVRTADEKMTGNRVVGVLVGLLGVGAIVGPDALERIGTGVLAQLAVLAAALAYAFAAVFGRRFRRMGLAPLTTATGQVIASTLMLLPVALLIDRPRTLAMPGATVWAAVLGLAALSTALGYVLYFRILATAGATNLLLVAFLVPVSAILLGSLFLGERLEPAHFVGMALIGTGLAAVDGRLLGLPNFHSEEARGSRRKLPIPAIMHRQTANFRPDIAPVPALHTKSVSKETPMHPRNSFVP